jgi:hypothetical protein
VFLVGFQLEDLHPPYGLTNPTSTEVCATDSDIHRQYRQATANKQALLAAAQPSRSTTHHADQRELLAKVNELKQKNVDLEAENARLQQQVQQLLSSSSIVLGHERVHATAEDGGGGWMLFDPTELSSDPAALPGPERKRAGGGDDDCSGSSNKYKSTCGKVVISIV